MRGLIYEGARVQHPEFGIGSIGEIRPDGKHTSVTFEIGRTEIVHLLDLQVAIDPTAGEGEV